MRKKGWMGIYSLHTKSNHYTLLTHHDGTDLYKNMNVRNLGGTNWNNSVGPMC